MLLVPVLLFAVYLVLDLSIGMTSGPTIAVMFVIQQLYMMLRAWTRVFFLAGELALYRNLQSRPFAAFDAAPVAPGIDKV
jgi:predicted membrane metal-binding protein